VVKIISKTDASRSFGRVPLLQYNPSFTDDSEGNSSNGDNMRKDVNPTGKMVGIRGLL
jgi:hypothetical protein